MIKSYWLAPLYGTFCSRLSSAIFEWDEDDIAGQLRKVKREQLRKEFGGHEPTEKKVSANISTAELAKHCKRRTCGVETTRRSIQKLLDAMWDLIDTTGLPLINADSMRHIWEVEQKHLPCIQDVPGLKLYTKVGTTEKGDEVLDVLRCGRGSSSLESFHRHQCNFIPGENQIYTCYPINLFICYTFSKSLGD